MSLACFGLYFTFPADFWPQQCLQVYHVTKCQNQTETIGSYPSSANPRECIFIISTEGLYRGCHVSESRLGLRRWCGIVDINVRYLSSNVDTRFLVRFNYSSCLMAGGTFQLCIRPASVFGWYLTADSAYQGFTATSLTDHIFTSLLNCLHRHGTMARYLIP
jgi:hypothetical protein